MEELEVKVDPMLFFIDQTSSDFSDVSDDEEKIKTKEFSKDQKISEEMTKQNDDAYNCTMCVDEFSSESDLQDLWPQDETMNEKSQDDDLQTNSDGAGDIFICPICSKNISTKGNLKVHLETHRPKGKYGCDICGRM